MNGKQDAIRQFYYRMTPKLLEASDEWGMDPYAWADASIDIQLTPIEQSLWDDIRMENCVMYPQFPVGPYFVDFGNPAAKVAIECDGARYHLDGERDARRQREIERLGWTVYRISGSECITDTREEEDLDTGCFMYIASPARVFIRSICDKHPIKRTKRTPQ